MSNEYAAAMDEIATLLTRPTGSGRGWAEGSLHPHIDRTYAELGADPVDWDAFCRALTRIGIESYSWTETGWAAWRCEPRTISAHARLRLHNLVSRPEQSRKPHYHITPLYNVDAILAGGLKPQLGKRSVTYGDTKKAVFLFSTIQALKTAHDVWIEDEFAEDAPIALLEVTVPLSIPISIDPAFERCVHEPIPASNIRVLSRDLLSKAGRAALMAMA